MGGPRANMASSPELACSGLGLSRRRLAAAPGEADSSAQPASSQRGREPCPVASRGDETCPLSAGSRGQCLPVWPRPQAERPHSSPGTQEGRTPGVRPEERAARHCPSAAGQALAEHPLAGAGSSHLCPSTWAAGAGEGRPGRGGGEPAGGVSLREKPYPHPVRVHVCACVCACACAAPGAAGWAEIRGLRV